jgi:hypothetical protein
VGALQAPSDTAGWRLTFAYLSAVSDMRVLADEDATAAFVGTWPWTDTQESQRASIC